MRAAADKQFVVVGMTHGLGRVYPSPIWALSASDSSLSGSINWLQIEK